jgi:hypothetical protein
MLAAAVAEPVLWDKTLQIQTKQAPAGSGY